MTPRPRSEVLAAFNRRDNIDYPPPCCDKCAAAQKLVTIADCEFESAEMERAAAQHLVEVAHRKEAELKGRAAALSIRETQVGKREFALESRHRWWRRLLVAGVALLVLWGMVP